MGRKRFSDEKTRFPLRGSAAVAAKGCTGQNVEMTLYRHPDSQPAACLPMQSLTILTTVHPRAAFAALSPSRGRKGKRRKTRFPLRGSAAVAAKGCTGWSVAMTLYRHPDRQPAACLPMQSLTILIVEHPRATAAALFPSRGRKSKRCFPLLSSQKAQGVSVGKLLFPLEGKCRCCGIGCTRGSREMILI